MGALGVCHPAGFVSDVASMSFQERLGSALTRSLPHLAPEARQAVADILNPTSLAIIAGVLVAWVPLRRIRVQSRTNSSFRSSLSRYLEEALAETAAQVQVNGGLAGVLEGLRFPVSNGYVTLSRGGGFSSAMGGQGVLREAGTLIGVGGHVFQGLVPAGSSPTGLPMRPAGSMARSLLDRLLGRNGASPPEDARLSQSEAAAIARRAAAGTLYEDRLILQGAWREGGRLLWHFWTATIGSGMTVTVDDATGEPTVHQFHGR